MVRNNPSGDPIERRSFLQRLLQLIMGLWGVGLIGAIAAYLRPPRALPFMGPTDIRVGPLDRFNQGEARFIPHEQHPFWVIRTERDQLIALSAVCTHLRCILRWDADRRELICPCHWGTFDLNGNVLAGPPSRPLRTFETHVRGGIIYVRLA